MRQFPKLRPCGWDSIIVLVVALLAVFCAVTVWGSQDSTGEVHVVISMDGEEVERCRLTEFPDGWQSYTNNGYTLQVTLAEELLPEGFGIRVAISDCPTQDCVHTGTITRSGQSIVCLPARIVVQLVGVSSDGGPDLIIG